METVIAVYVESGGGVCVCVVTFARRHTSGVSHAWTAYVHIHRGLAARARITFIHFVKSNKFLFLSLRPTSSIQTDRWRTASCYAGHTRHERVDGISLLYRTYSRACARANIISVAYAATATTSIGTRKVFKMTTYAYGERARARTPLKFFPWS